ncbi:hypothetical protein BGW36DRAFT_373522 [Talaromyces proteolyticus]|uniref:Uncharacterized protein n=1 Tax=Talaromyces proteolyticus TaxID=1131652 RepID=A0AAD4PXI9_9EURO|nr:uncharacterized protein BGW36DRAFT_373522 [Talaromyces proteolyticus]KAH8700145.1 hypothetical protein BGW36DRAFT_373522 [Talaromyces proteolyticus]
MAKYTVFTVFVVQQLGWSPLTVAASDLFSRADSSSCASSYSQCGSAYPADFCCPSNTSCLGVDSNSTVVCCPSGSDCSYIQPVLCNIQAQNATADPTATIKTTRLSGALSSCGEACCPFGYSCANNNTCVLETSTSSAASASASGSSSTVAPSTLSTSISAATATLSLTAPSSIATSTASSALSSSSTQAQVAATCQDFPAKAIAAGFFPGLISGALAAAIIVMCRRRNKVEENIKQQKQQQMRHRSSGGPSLEISDPIPADENSSFRTDFLLQRFSGRYPSNHRSKSVLRRTGTRVKSLLGSSHPGESPRWDSASPPPIPTHIPVTPPQQTDQPPFPARQPSTESIKVYSPPNMLAANPALRPGAARTIQQERPNTTFSEVMEKVGFQNANGDPYYRVTETPAPPGNIPPKIV